MADIARIRQIAIRRTVEKLAAAVTWGDMVQAFQAASPEDRAAFARALTGQAGEFQRRARRIVRDYLTTQAAATVDAALADGSLTLNELEELLL